MLNFRKSMKTGIAALFLAITAVGAVVPDAMAQGRDRGDRRDNDRRDNDRRDFGRRDNDRRDFDRGNRGRNNWRPDWRGDRRWDGPSRSVFVRPRPPSYYRYYAMPRDRYYQGVRVWRPYGRPYTGFGFYYRDNDAARFLGLTALSFIALNALNESQQRAHEQAMIDAANAQIGEPIYWNDAGRSGRVTAVREGMTPDGRQCREFQQEVTIDGRPQEAYGTACLQPDGSWQVVNENG